VGLNNIINRNFPGINALTVSMVEDSEPKDYHTRFFLFLRAVPSAKSDASPTGRTYDNSNAVTFKIEAERAIAMSFALEQMASGKGKLYDDTFGAFSMFADGAKSQYGGGKKSMGMMMGQNNKSNKSMIILFFSEGEKKVQIFLTPYEAHGLATTLDILGRKCIDFEMSGPGVVVKKPQISTPKSNFQAGNKQEDPFTPTLPSNGPPQNTASATKVANDFAGFFDNSPFG